jgi:hypothetical protein
MCVCVCVSESRNRLHLFETLSTFLENQIIYSQLYLQVNLDFPRQLTPNLDFSRFNNRLNNR